MGGGDLPPRRRAPRRHGRSRRSTSAPRRLVEIAVATLATDRALLLLGVPGTAKTWLGEHLAAAISGASTLVVQGTAGTPEESLRYGWNYARLLAEGPSPRGAGAEPGDAGDGDRRDRPGRGAHPDPRRRAGRADHDPLGEDPADPRARRRGPGPPGLQRHRHRQQPRQGRQRAVLGAAPPLQHRRAAAARHPRGGGRDRPHPRRGARPQPLRCRPTSSRCRRSTASSRSSASCARASPPTGARPSSRRPRRCRRPRRSR